MTKRRPDKPAAQPQEQLSVLPMDLREGDRLMTESGEWEVASRPSSGRGGKVVYGRIQRPGEPASVKDVTWSAIERITVRRAG